MRSQRTVYNTRGSVPTVGTATSVANTVAGLSAVVNKPTVQDNTLLIAQLVVSASLTALSAPSGWTALQGATATGAYNYYIYYKYIPVAANEGATTYTWSWTTNNRTNSVIILPVYGVSQTTQFDTTTVSVINNQSTSGAPSPALNPPTNVLLVGGANANTDAGSTITVPTQMTEAAQVGGARNSIAYESRATGGRVGGPTAQYARTWTTSPAATVSAWMIAIRPTDTSTWTKPNWAQEVTFILFDGGGGGGSGRKGAASSGRGGGGSGAPGRRMEVSFPAAALPATASIVVGGGGSGGAAQATNSVDGRTGGSGGNSAVIMSGFSTIGFASKATGGSNGQTAAVGGGAVASDGWTVKETSSSGANGSTAGTAATASNGVPSGGGGGSGVTSGDDATGTGGSGGLVRPFLTTVNTNSGAEGASGSTGTADPTGLYGGQGGAGGKGSTVGAGGNGGTGGAPGGGGGGGGGSTDSVGDSGAGGDGGSGAVIVIAVG